MCSKKILRIAIMKDKNISVFFSSSFYTSHHSYIQARMFFKQNAFVCCVRNKYHCSVNKLSAYCLPIKEKLIYRFFFPLSVFIFFSLFFHLPCFIFYFFFLYFYSLIYFSTYENFPQ